MLHLLIQNGLLLVLRPMELLIVIVVTIKGPYSYCEVAIETSAASDIHFCLIKREVHYTCLLSNPYRFCVFTFSSMKTSALQHIERIQREESFWEECLVKSEHFFVIYMLASRNPRPLVHMSTTHDHLGLS